MTRLRAEHERTLLYLLPAAQTPFWRHEDLFVSGSASSLRMRRSEAGVEPEAEPEPTRNMMDEVD